ncbi:MAG TPA: cytochrome C oxidase subunit IV family protein [Vicinamibacterales bacterium]|nr:cytochrome C oxidase subunit IV family protein [Vicinamibacterales bacterium]
MFGHVSPLKVYIGIFAALMVLTVVTILVAYVDLGEMNKVVAMGIASFKATLVVLYFMHVKYSSRLTKLIVVSGFFFLAILLTLTMADYGSRQWVNPPAILQ